MIYLSLLVCIIGAVLYMLLNESTLKVKVSVLGRDTFVVGLLAFLLQFTRLINLFH
jgi:hypothetical protein